MKFPLPAPVRRALPAGRQQGVSLLIVLMILVIVSLLGVASMQISLLGERGARNDRDQQLAWQGADAALADAAIDLMGPNHATHSRTAAIRSGPAIPESGCHAGAGPWQGLCNPATAGTAKPAWLTVDFTDASPAAPTVALGTFTGRHFAHAGELEGRGVQPALAPRYLIEDVSAADVANAGAGMVTARYPSAAPAGAQAAAGRLYRVTAIGFGPRGDIQAVAQAVYRN
jgi:type IV pilus assembly protein PilX